MTPVWGWIAAKNKYTKEVLDTGWTPVISAMLISRLGWHNDVVLGDNFTFL
jgi:solute carrier family 41